MRNLYGFVVLFAASIGIAAVIYASVRKSLVDLLDEVARLPAATTFYSRLFLICVFFMALSTAVGTTFNLKAEAAFMEYVWVVAKGLSEVFRDIALFLLGFLVLATVLVVVLRGRNDQ